MGVFDQVFAITRGHEGDNLDLTPGDTGNWTSGIVGVGKLAGSRYGISAASYPDLDIASLTVAGAEAIYRRDYFALIRGDDLPPPLALLVFDAAVNNGVDRASRWLQMAVGVAEDGVIGDQTVAAVRDVAAARGGASLCAEYLARRMNFMGSLSTWPAFGLGWSRRLAMLPYQSMTMIEGSPASSASVKGSPT